MLIPINQTTFKKTFLDGNGNFEVVSDQNIWQTLYDNGQPFSENIDKLVELKFSSGTSKDFKFGKTGKLALNVGLNSEVSGLIDLVWKTADNHLIKKYNLEKFLTPDKLYLALTFNAKADGSVSGNFPSGALSANFGIGAGGYVGYTRLMPYLKTKSVKEIITDLFAETRLPQQINSVADIPKEGEIVSLNYGGYLKLSAGLSWGYSLTGTSSFDIKDLALAANYKLKMVAGTKIGYQIGGDFAIDVSRGSSADWARYVVRKKRRSEFNFAADFGFDADFELKGLPSSADDFLMAVFGTKAKTFLDYFAKAEKYSNLDELEKAVGSLANKYLQKFSDAVIGKALSNATLKELLAKAEQIVNFYNSLEDKIVNLYEDYLDKIPQLDKTLDDILKLKKFENLSKVTDELTWEIIKKLSGEKFYELLINQTAFGEFLNLVQKAKDFLHDSATAQIRKIIGDLKAEFHLDKLFAQLEKFDTPEKLKNLADEKLKGLVERLLGKAFKELGNFKDASKQINDTLKQITNFKNKWYEKLTDATKQSFKLNLNYAYTQTSETDALIDVEINLAEKAGRDLADFAAAGDFSGVLQAYNPNIVRINPKTAFTQNLSKAGQLQINVLGWNYKRLVELLQKTEHAIQTEPNGLIHVFTIDTQINQLTETKKKGKLLEEVKSNFLFRAVGATFQPTGSSAPVDEETNKYLIATLNKMAVNYQISFKDTNTKPDELRLYLDLAEYLGLISSRNAFIRELQSQFPDGLDNISIEYVVRYDDQTVRNAFTLSGDELKEFARQTVRQLMAAKYTGMRDVNWMARVGFAYLNNEFAKIYYEKGGGQQLKTDAKFITLPAWFIGGSQSLQVPLELAPPRLALVLLFDTERDYVERLNKLDQLIDKCLKQNIPIPLDDLAKASRDFVGMADELDKLGRTNSFFMAFDKLAQAGSSGKWRRESAMVLTIKTDKGEVTKYLMV